METARIYIRPMTKEDTDMIVGFRNKPFVRERFIFRDEVTREMHLKRFKEKIETGEIVQFVIVLKDGDVPFGSVYFGNVDREKACAEYGIFIGREDFLGRGYGTEAAELALKYAFSEMKLKKVYLRLLADNERARKSYEKVGFKMSEKRDEYPGGSDCAENVIFMEIENCMD